MGPLLRRAGLRHLGRHPWQMGLAVLGVALGVAVVVAVDLANASAGIAFGLATEAVSGRATHQVVGGPSGLPDAAYRRLVLGAGARDAAPVVEEWVRVLEPESGPRREAEDAGEPREAEAAGPRRPRRLLRLLGVDPLAERPFRPFLAGWGGEGQGSARLDLGPLLTRPGAVLLTAETAHELGLAPGATFDLRTPGGVRTATLAGVLEPAGADARRALADLLIADVATAQELAGRVGTLSRIDLIVPEGAPGERLLARVRAALPAGAEILAAGARSRTTEQMTRAFRLNLTALSLLALLCGLFLIYNTITFSVVQRRALIGTLRAIGVTRGQVFALVLAEAGGLAVAGTAAGLLAGVALGRGLVDLVTQTINDLYFVLSVRSLEVPPAALVKGAAAGIGATLLAAAVPAWEAASAPPRAAMLRSDLESRLRRALPRATLAGAGLLAAGGVLLALPGGIVLAFAGLFAMIVGFALLAPAATALLMRLLRRPMGAAFGVLGRMAAGGVVAALSRTAVAIAALVIAVSVTVGVGVMIGSFRSAVERWLEISLQADVYVAAPSRAGGFAGGTFAPEVAARAARLPGVASVHSIRRFELPAPGGNLRLLAVDVDPRAPGVDLRRGDPQEVWPAFFDRGELLVSEVLASRRGLLPGSRLALRTVSGVRRFRVAGVFRDYASDQGLVMMSRRTYLAHWRDPALSGFSLVLAPGVDAEPLVAQLRGTLGAELGLYVESNRALKRASLAIFDRTFRITGVLRLLAGLVAFVGVLAALMALELERARELGVLRANGMTPGQVGRLITAQTGLMGLAAGLLSLPVGLALAAVMIFIVNRRSFGWSMGMEVPAGPLVQAVALALAAALLAGLYPAWSMARTSPAVALREE